MSFAGMHRHMGVWLVTLESRAGDKQLRAFGVGGSLGKCRVWLGRAVVLGRSRVIFIFQAQP
jgi:hypothetical protein